MNFQLIDKIPEESAPLSADNINEQITIAEKWLENAYNWFLSWLPNLIAALVILVLGLWITKLLCKIFVKAMKRGKADQTVITFLHSIINAASKIVVIICTLSTLGFDVTTLIAAIGAAAVTVGLALKDSLADVASGTLIIINKKFKTGDYLETEGLQGKVIKIEMMYTTLRTYDNKEIMIPNSRLASNNITNYFVLEERRIDLTVPIGYSEDIDKVRKIILNEMDNHPKVLHDRNNKVSVQKLNESSVDLCVWIWCKSEDYWTVMDDMQENIKKALDKNGIIIPFNQLDVHLIEDNPKQKQTERNG